MNEILQDVSLPALTDAIEANLFELCASMSPGITIEKVDDIAGLKQWRRAFTAGFGMSDCSSEAFFDAFRWISFEAHLPMAHHIAWLDGKPVASSSALYGAGVVGIYNVAVVPEARRQGIGALITLAPLREARSQGYRAGILQASAMGAGVYRRLGFQEYCQIGIYEWLPEAGLQGN